MVKQLSTNFRVVRPPVRGSKCIFLNDVPQKDKVPSLVQEGLLKNQLAVIRPLEALNSFQKDDLKLKAVKEQEMEDRHIKCSCQKSRCLKLYCQCFAHQVFCGKLCKCEDCYNTKLNQLKRQLARKEIKQRNPVAFQKQFKQEQSKSKGCNCKKSGCNKRYCECLKMKLKCTSLCRCSACKNRQRSQMKMVDQKPVDIQTAGKYFVKSA